MTDRTNARPEAPPHNRVATRAAAQDPWQAVVLTLFPDLFPGPLGASLTGKALQDDLWRLSARDIRAHGIGRHKNVDGRPAGGGAGMVLRPDVVADAIDATEQEFVGDLPRIYVSPRGEPFTRDLAAELASGPGALIIAGRFEGLDERVIRNRQLREVSIGDYVLTGGELAAMVIIDACVRRLTGVLGNATSIADESFETPLLEHPHYTKPVAWEGQLIPDVLLSGDHAAIAKWKSGQALAVTRARRPDLLTDRAKTDATPTLAVGQASPRDED